MSFVDLVRTAAAEVTRVVKAVDDEAVFIKLIAQRDGHRRDRPAAREAGADGIC